MDAPQEAATLATEVTGWERNMARQGMPFARARYHQAFPLGSAERRALAKRALGTVVPAFLEPERYGAPTRSHSTYSTNNSEIING